MVKGNFSYQPETPANDHEEKNKGTATIKNTVVLDADLDLYVTVTAKKLGMKGKQEFIRYYINFYKRNFTME